MGANAEHKITPPGAHEPVRWIGREPVSPEAVVPLAPPETSVSDGGGSARAKWMAGAVAVAVIAIVAAILWRGQTTEPATATLASQQAVPLVSVMSPGVSAVTSTVTFTGTIAARYDMPIGIEGDAGRIVGVYVEAGDRVKRGQLLAKIDESVWQPQVNRLAASLEEAKAQAALSAAEYRRAAAVESAGALSAEEIEKRRALSITDAAKVKVAAAMLMEAEARLNRTRVVAPADGIVLTRKAEVGQTASPGGEALFRLANGGEIEMRGQVAEQDMSVLTVGQPADVRLVGSAEPFEGRVRLLGAVIDPLTRLGDIRITLKPNPALRPGAFARGSVLVSKAERPILPQTAVLSDVKGPYVYVIGEGSRVERRDVQVGGTTSAGIIITKGLSGSERIVTTAAGFLREGEKVNVAATPVAVATS
ncbi:MAG: efflux RND transporter periplasmic adaptor subunit [Steroidobacteraceae bacterium]